MFRNEEETKTIGGGGKELEKIGKRKEKRKGTRKEKGRWGKAKQSRENLKKGKKLVYDDFERAKCGPNLIPMVFFQEPKTSD